MKTVLYPKRRGLVLVLLLSILLFAGMETFRRQNYGEMRTVHAWFSDLTLQFTRNWHRDGIIPLRGALFWKPASPEFPDLPSRRMHSSYPSGMALPVYAAALLTRMEPMPGHITFVNSCCHFIVLLCCVLMVFIFVHRAGGAPADACAFACVPLILLCFLPGPFYLFDKCYFAYEAVLPWVALYLLLELLRDDAFPHRVALGLGIAQGTVAFMGAFTEWLFPLVAAAVFVKRLLSGEWGCRPPLLLRKSVVFWGPIGLALSLFAAQVAFLGGAEYLQDRFLLRTGLSRGIISHLTTLNPFWRRHLVLMFGRMGMVALAASAIILVLLSALVLYRRCKRQRQEPSSVSALWMGAAALIPCIAHVELLRNQSSFVLHSFEALKFCIPLALLPLVLLPMAIMRALNLNWSAWTLRRGIIPSVLPLLALLTALGYVAAMHPNIASLYAHPVQEGDSMARAVFLDEHTGPADVVFTPSVELVQNDSPVYAAYSMKLVHHARHLLDVYELLAPVEGPYSLCFFYPTAQTPDDPALADLTAHGELAAVYGEYTLCRIPRELFWETWNQYAALPGHTAAH